MKFCFLASAESIHAYKWVTFFARRGHDVRWFSLAPSTFDDLAGARLHVVGGEGPGPVRLARATLAVRRALKDDPPDLLHAHYVGRYGLIGLLTNFHPFIATAWGSDVLFAGRSPIKRPFVRRVLQRADVITCDANHMVKAIRSFDVSPERIRLIYFGVDTKRFSPGAADLAMRERLCLGSAPAVISLRSHEPVYDIATLIRAVPLVLRNVPSAKFIVAGGGSESDLLRALSEELGVAAHVHFIGRVPNESLPPLLRSMDVYVSTALSDAGIAASTAEAMACGISCVVTRSGENEAWITDNVSGALVPVKDPSALAHRLTRLLADPAARHSIGAAGRRVIQTRNDYDAEMTKMEQVYEEACVQWAAKNTSWSSRE
ncbi:MAG: glycosyltransferase [Gemmatimonadaceae bacterium]